jgi:hypothetical protein
MLYSEFLEGTGLTANREASKAYELINVKYMADQSMSKQDAYNLYLSDPKLQERAKWQADQYEKIEIEIYSDIPEKPGYCKHTSNRTYGEILRELRSMLAERHAAELEILDYGLKLSVGNKAEDQIPKFNSIYAVVNYGGSEGIYLDVIAFTGQENERHMLFIAKTLCTDAASMFAMFRLAAAIQCSIG